MILQSQDFMKGFEKQLLKYFDVPDKKYSKEGFVNDGDKFIAL